MGTWGLPTGAGENGPRRGDSVEQGTELDMDFPGGSAGEESARNMGDLGSIPGLGRSPGEGKGYTPVFWPGEFHGRYSPWGHKGPDTTERCSPSHTVPVPTQESMTCFPFVSNLTHGQVLRGAQDPRERVGVEEGHVACVRLSVLCASWDQYFQMSLPSPPLLDWKALQAKTGPLRLCVPLTLQHQLHKKCLVSISGIRE